MLESVLRTGRNAPLPAGARGAQPPGGRTRRACMLDRTCAMVGAAVYQKPTRAALSAFLLLAAGATVARAELPALADGHGIHVESARQLDPRQLDAEVSTAALQHPVDVRILLPDDYAAHPHRRYPVLYLFHGTSGRPSDWINFGNAEQTTAGLPLIVVLPDAGFNGDGGGWFTNWYNGGAGGPRRGETFHIARVVPGSAPIRPTSRTRAG